MRYRLFFKSSSKSSIVSLSTPAEPAFALTAFQASYTRSFGMTNGFDALTHLLLLPVGFEVQRLDPSSLLGRHYPSSSLVQDGPSQCSASDFSPRSFSYLSFYLGIGTTGSHSSTREPGSGSRPLNAGRRPPSNQVSGRLVPGELPAPGFDDIYLVYDASSKVHSRSSL